MDVSKCVCLSCVYCITTVHWQLAYVMNASQHCLWMHHCSSDLTDVRLCWGSSQELKALKIDQHYNKKFMKDAIANITVTFDEHASQV
eukprot:scaffold112933_cov37-Prasinocladus_malaysianus.AAC.1